MLRSRPTSSSSVAPSVMPSLLPAQGNSREHPLAGNIHGGSARLYFLSAAPFEDCLGVSADPVAAGGEGGVRLELAQESRIGRMGEIENEERIDVAVRHEVAALAVEAGGVSCSFTWRVYVPSWRMRSGSTTESVVSLGGLLERAK
jgi:hypothetical protein